MKLVRKRGAVRMKIAEWTHLFLLTLVMGCSTTYEQHNAIREPILVVPLCELLQNPLKYSGKTVTTTARIASFKEGTGIWDPACRRRGADLHTEESARSSASIVELDKALRSYGMGDHPVVATLTGVWLPYQFTGGGFLPQPRHVFLASTAANIGRSAGVERR